MDLTHVQNETREHDGDIDEHYVPPLLDVGRIERRDQCKGAGTEDEGTSGE